MEGVEPRKARRVGMMERKSLRRFLKMEKRRKEMQTTKKRKLAKIMMEVMKVWVRGEETEVRMRPETQEMRDR
jgi:hypothetical protein